MRGLLSAGIELDLVSFFFISKSLSVSVVIQPFVQMTAHEISVNRHSDSNFHTQLVFGIISI